jgi:hypothetical protein
LGLAALAARGFGLTTVGIAVGVLVVGAGFDVTYRIRRREDRVLSHRRVLDWIVRRQRLGIAVFGSGVGAALQSVDAAPLRHAPPVVQALTVGLVVAATAIYVSSLIDCSPCGRYDDRDLRACRRAGYMAGNTGSPVVLGVTLAP